MQRLRRPARSLSPRSLLAIGPLAAAAVLAAAVLALPARIADAQGAERAPQIKAACIYNFVKFVDWPDRVLPGNNTLTIGILGSSPVGSALGGLNGKPVKNRTLVVRQ